MDPVINSVLQSPLARNLNHIATDSTQFTYHVEQNAPPLSLKKGYIDSSQSFVGFDNTYSFTLPQWGYLSKTILRLQYQIKPTQRTHVTPVLPMYHMIEKVELMSHNNVIETLYGDSIMIKHAYYSETGSAATKMMGTLNVPPESSNYVDISALFRNAATGTPFNPFDHTQWNNTTNCRTVTLFLELPFSFTDNPAMYFDTRFVEYLTVNVKLTSTKHGVPLFQAACCTEFDMGSPNIQFDRTRHKNAIIADGGVNADWTGAGTKDNFSKDYENKVNPSENLSTKAATDLRACGVSNKVTGCEAFFYRPFYTRCIGTGTDGQNMYLEPYRDGKWATGSLDALDAARLNKYGAESRIWQHQSASTTGCLADGETWAIAATCGLDPFELQLGARPHSRLPSKVPRWMEGFYPCARRNGIYACAHAGEPRYLRVGACNFDPTHYTVGYWGFLQDGGNSQGGYGVNTRGLSDSTIKATPTNSAFTGTHEQGIESATGTLVFGTANDETWNTDNATGTKMGKQGTTVPNYSDGNIMMFAVTWAQYGGQFVYSQKTLYGTRAPYDKKDGSCETRQPGNTMGAFDSGMGGEAPTSILYDKDNLSNGVALLGADNLMSTRGKYAVNIETKVALIERFYAKYPYLNLSNQPTSSSQRWEGYGGNTDHGHGFMDISQIVVEGSQNNASFRGLPEANSVSLKLLTTYLSLHDRVREQVSMDNFKDNMPATILMNDTFQEYNGLEYGSESSPWATSTNQTMVVPLRSKNLAYAISIVAYRNRSNAQLVGGGVYNLNTNGVGCKNSKMDMCFDADNVASSGNPIYDGFVHGKDDYNPRNADARGMHEPGDLPIARRFGASVDHANTKTGLNLAGTPVTVATGQDGVLSRWNGRKASIKVNTGGSVTAAPLEIGNGGSEFDNNIEGGMDIAHSTEHGPAISSDPSFVWPAYKVVENFKTVKPTHVKLSIAGQTIYETAQETALANSYYATTSDSYTPINGGGQWFVEKDLDNLPYYYNNGTATRGEMGSIARLPNIVGATVSGGTLQEHCDAQVITFGLNKTDQLSNNGALGLSSATNCQLEMKFAEPCRVSVYVHYHATLQIDSNTGVMSRSLDV